MAVFGMPMTYADEMDEATDVFVRLNHDVAATATVATIGTAARNMGLAPKAACSRTAVPCFTENADLIYKHA
jgi:hypothetical protein